MELFAPWSANWIHWHPNRTVPGASQSPNEQVVSILRPSATRRERVRGEPANEIRARPEPPRRVNQKQEHSIQRPTHGRATDWNIPTILGLTPRHWQRPSVQYFLPPDQGRRPRNFYTGPKCREYPREARRTNLRQPRLALTRASTCKTPRLEESSRRILPPTPMCL